MPLTANETVIWSKVGGADAALFTLTGSTLSVAAKDFEIPTDADGNNTYVVQVRATDTTGNVTDQTITVTVTNVDEAVAEKRSVMASGQSNAVKLYQQSQSDFEAVLNATWTTTVNRLANGATSGSAAMKESANDPATDPWWYDDVGLVFGPAWDTFAAAVAAEVAAGFTIKAIYWDQGESDFGDIASGGAPYRARYKATLLTIFAAMRSLVGGSPPIVICPIGRRGDAIVTNTGYQTIRELQKELDTENAYITLTPEKFDLADDGAQHLSNAAYDLLAPRIARKVLSVLGETVTGSIDGMTVFSASRNGTAVTVTVAHDQGTDFTPTTSIAGFVYFASGTEVAISSAVRTDATTITLTLGTTPTGTEILYYGYNVMTGVTVANLVHGNSAQALPLRSAKVTPTDVTPVTPPPGDTNVSSIMSDVVFNSRAKDYGGAQVLPNAVTAPADGSSQSTYDRTFGSTSTVGEGNDPTFAAAAGGVPALIVNDGGDTLQIAASIARLQSLASSGVWSFYGLYKAPATHTTAEIFMQCGGNQAATPGLSLRYTGTVIRLATADGTATGNVTLQTVALPTTGYYLLVFTYDPATKAFKVYVNSVTPTATGTATAAKSTPATINSAIFFGAHGAGAGFIEDALINHIVTDAEVSSIKSYLQTKHGITIF